VNDKIKNCNKRIDELEDRNNTRLTSLETAVNSHSHELVEMKGDIRNINKNIESLTKNVSSNQTKIEDLLGNILSRLNQGATQSSGTTKDH
jgi:chromosome segregation ATPase